MSTMHAAVVSSFDEPPHYQEFPVPTVEDDDHELVDVLAVGLHPRVRSGARGSHYTSTGDLPMVPGIDGVARREDGSLVFFVADDDMVGPMAEHTVLDARRTVRLPAGADVVRIAAAMNPAMSSWVALRRRIALRPGQSVLVLGAGGNAGAMAMQVARLLGAGEVIGAARRPGDGIVALDQVGERAKDVDVVLDYLWGEPAEQAMTGILTHRTDRSAALDWIQIGAVASPDITLPSVLLRGANLRIQGNGQGAVSARGYLAELPSLVEATLADDLEVTARAVPLADVEQAWAGDDGGARQVVVTSALDRCGTVLAAQ